MRGSVSFLGRLGAPVLAGLVLLAGLALLAAEPVAARGPLVVATDEWPPYEFLQEDTVAGLCTEVLTGVLERMGERFLAPELYPWRRGLDMLARGEVDILYSGIFDARRLPFAHYGAESLVDSHWVLLARADRAPDVAPASLDDLAGQRVGVVIGYFYTPEFDDWARNNPLVERVASDSNLLAMLFQGRLDYAVGDARNLRHHARALAREGGFREFVVPSSAPFGLYPMFSRERLSQDFVDRFDAALRAFKAEPGYRLILERYSD